MRRIFHLWQAAALPLALAACGSPDLSAPAVGEPEVTQIRNAAPAGAAPGTCWERDATPAVVETVTEQVVVQPAEIGSDGEVVRSAVYKSESHQRIVEERREVWFRTPCPDEMTPEFVASLQRALGARGYYDGPVNGRMSAATRRAVRAYQRPEGLDSGILSLAAARNLGLAVVDLSETEEDQAPARTES